MKIALGNDHGGYALRKTVIDFLQERGYDLIDFGTKTEDSVDYPDYAKLVANAVKDKTADYGILICGTGIGIGIAANKVKGVRCAVVHNAFTAEMTKRHNNANVIAFGARVINEATAKEILTAFFDAEFEQGRHVKRVEKIHEIENQ